MTAQEQYKKFLASAPEAQIERRTIEIYHPEFSQLYRFVNDRVEQSFTLESNAPRNAGETVAFGASGMNIVEPNEKDLDQQLTVTFGAFSAFVDDELSNLTATGLLIPVELIYRKYYSADTSEPVLVLTVSAASLQFENYNRFAFSGQDIDFTNKNAGEIYTLERFPTLRNA